MSLSFGGQDINNFGYKLASRLIELDGYQKTRVFINHFMGLSKEKTRTQNFLLKNSKNYKLYRSNHDFWENYLKANIAILANGLTQLEAMHAHMPHICILNSDRNSKLAPVDFIPTEYIISENYLNASFLLLKNIIEKPELLFNYYKILRRNNFQNGVNNVVSKLSEIINYNQISI